MAKRYYHRPDETLEFTWHRLKFAGLPADAASVTATHRLLPHHRYLQAKSHGWAADEAEADGHHAEARRLREAADRLRFDPEA